MTSRNDIERLFKAHYARMHRLAVALLHDEDLARDIVHDIFAALLGGEMRVAALSDADINVAGGYLLKSVRNRCLNHIRDCEIHQRIANRYFLDNEDTIPRIGHDDETIARIYALIKSDISSQARKVMELRFPRECRLPEIAAAMGISETAVYRHLSHALTVIRQNSMKMNSNLRRSEGTGKYALVLDIIEHPRIYRGET
ncbi:RNA polymerase sigma factor [Muribaculum gordoncarteri]|uniref:RNA polymerase sigma factor n=1 Tax=Muribaculum gordoncarteri TaxID=2530390 RepID=UPI003F67585F